MVDTPRKKPRKGAPLSRHPLFPAIVALWFGALFGLGSLALRPALVEQFVIAAGIDTLIPATAPPLGPTTRILIALAMTGLGALLGGSLARRIARPTPELRQRRRGAAVSASEVPAPRALSRDDYFGAGAGLDARRAAEDPAIKSNKRRSLALLDDIGPLEIHETVPVPGSSHEAAPVDNPDPATWDLPADAAMEEEGAEEDAFIQMDAPARPLDLADIRESDNLSFAPPALAPPTFAPPAFAPPSFTPESFAPPTHPKPDAEAGVLRFAPPSEAVWFDAEEPMLAALPEVPPADDVTTDIAVTVHESPLTPPQSEARPAPALIPPVGAAAERLIASSVDDLSPVQLVERLAISLQRRRQAVAASALPAVQAPAPRADLDHPAAPLAMPAALRPLDVEPYGDEDSDDASLDSLPPRQFAWQAMPAAEPLFGKPASHSPGVEADDAQEAEEPSATDSDVDLEESYSSLLDLSRPGAQRASFIRIDDGEDDDGMVEPVVVFPGQRTPLATSFVGSRSASQAPSAAETAAASFPAGTSAAGRLFDRPSESSAIPARTVDQEEADRALRAALATLQRMSGAA